MQKVLTEVSDNPQVNRKKVQAGIDSGSGTRVLVSGDWWENLRADGWMDGWQRSRNGDRERGTD